MKTITVLRLLVSMTFLAGWCAGAQPKLAIPTQPPPSSNYVTVLVTNWYDAPPGLRTVNDQVYNPEIGQLWKFVIIPAGAAIQGAAYSGSIQPIDVTFVWGRERERQTVVIHNFPYNPRDFTHDRDNRYSDIVTARQLNLRLFPLDIQTNYSELGRAWICQRTYDYGLPYTGKLPVATLEKVPADGATALPAASITGPALPPSAYSHGALSDRLAAIQNLPTGTKRDNSLFKVATDAAGQGDVTLLRQALQIISSQFVHDHAARLAAIALLQNGKTGDAYEIAGTITDPKRHRMAIEELDQRTPSPQQ